VRKLIRDLADPETFERVTGKPPVDLANGASRHAPRAA